MKNQPLISRIAETTALIVMWPCAIAACICYMTVSVSLEFANRVMGVWE